MTIKEMHYDFKRKLNKVDSQQNENLRVPEIDLALREAEEIFIKMVAFPRVKSYMGFESSQRSIDDIRTLVINEYPVDIINNTSSLPDNYLHFIKGDVEMSKGKCKAKGRLFIRQHDDDFERSPFDRSSFEWRTINGVFYEKGVKFYINDSTVLTKFFLSYVKQPRLMHNAEDFRGGNYELLSGQVLTGFVNCELPEQTHREIVDIAVLLVTGQLSSDYQAKVAKLNLNNLTN